jgi:hypothetical protein
LCQVEHTYEKQEDEELTIEEGQWLRILSTNNDSKFVDGEEVRCVYMVDFVIVFDARCS